MLLPCDVLPIWDGNISNGHCFGFAGERVSCDAVSSIQRIVAHFDNDGKSSRVPGWTILQGARPSTNTSVPRKLHVVRKISLT